MIWKERQKLSNIPRAEDCIHFLQEGLSLTLLAQVLLASNFVEMPPESVLEQN